MRLTGLFFLLLLALFRSLELAGAAAPPCAVVRSAPPVLARASALDRFAASRACFPTQPRAESSPDGRLRPSPAMRRHARLVAGASRRRQLARLARSRPISIPGSRSNPTSGQTSLYRSTMAVLQKSPPVSRKSTRGPHQFKNNYKIALGFMFRPLDFSEIEPAIQEIEFCMLAPVV